MSLIKHFSTKKLRLFTDNGIKTHIADLQSHPKSVERNVKLVTEASRVGYDFESRHLTILAKIKSYI